MTRSPIEAKEHSEMFQAERNVDTFVLFQINAVPFLQFCKQHLNLPTETRFTQLPDTVFRDIHDMGVEAIYLLGVFPESIYAKNIAEQYAEDHLRGMKGLTRSDLRGSIFAIPTFDSFHPEIATDDEDFLAFKKRMERIGLKIILDMVPNHTAVDSGNKDLVMRFTPEEFRNIPGDAGHNFIEAENGVIYAYGKDASPQEWCDTLQYALHKPEVLTRLKEMTLRLAKKCHGLRFDMAHLLLPQIFTQSWGWTGINLENLQSLTHFWRSLSNELQEIDPNFITIAEAYGEGAQRLLEYFDGVYDKEYYDVLEAISLGRLSISDFQEIFRKRIQDEYAHRRVRFLQNHDEQPYKKVFGKAANALLLLQLYEPSGIFFLSDSQYFGHPHKLPVQVRKYPQEPLDTVTMELLYRELQRRKSDSIFKQGKCSLLNTSAANQVVGVDYRMGERGVVIGYNLSDSRAYGSMYLPDRSRLHTGVSLLTNTNISNVDTSLSSEKAFILDPWEVQMFEYSLP